MAYGDRSPTEAEQLVSTKLESLTRVAAGLIRESVSREWSAQLQGGPAYEVREVPYSGGKLEAGGAVVVRHRLVRSSGPPSKRLKYPVNHYVVLESPEVQEGSLNLRLQTTNPSVAGEAFAPTSDIDCIHFLAELRGDLGEQLKQYLSPQEQARLSNLARATELATIEYFQAQSEAAGLTFQEFLDIAGLGIEEVEQIQAGQEPLSSSALGSMERALKLHVQDQATSQLDVEALERLNPIEGSQTRRARVPAVRPPGGTAPPRGPAGPQIQ